MADEDQAVLWPSEENYPAFVAACDGFVQPTYADFLEVAQPMLDRMLATGLKVFKVDPDVDAMVEWCRANFGNVESKARAAYAGFVVLGLGDKSDAGGTVH